MEFEEVTDLAELTKTGVDFECDKPFLLGLFVRSKAVGNFVDDLDLLESGPSANGGKEVDVFVDGDEGFDEVVFDDFNGKAGGFERRKSFNTEADNFELRGTRFFLVGFDEALNDK